ncbi:DNA-binding protein [Streptomyces venezuelae]|uniref:DNA-binding protein n=1 Tax=Streptomyces venezuelae TaxID=54571 RepID=A0A5P2D6P3_STRVZ|nr:helix-turn-helix domain-containing protein [Streptomyces venezuelae]QES50423.1 DNA-binding protein [Streptomyces venezuelae]
MADRQLSAPTRASYGIRHDNRVLRDRYVKIGNHLAQHRELSITAIGLATHIQSLPAGAKVTVKSLSERFPEGEVRIAAALRELEEHGYLTRYRERLPSGQVVSHVISYNVPLALRRDDGPSPEPPAPKRKAPEDPEAPQAPVEPVEPEGSVAAPPAQPTPEPPAPAAVPALPEPSSAAGPELHAQAAELLARLRLRDPRLLLSERDVARLAPAAVAWLERGVRPAVVSGVLSGGLPPEPIRAPAALLAHRLRVLLPPALRASPPSGPMPRDRTIHPLRNCDGCDRAFRAPTPGHCEDCASRPAATAA